MDDTQLYSATQHDKNNTTQHTSLLFSLNIVLFIVMFGSFVHREQFLHCRVILVVVFVCACVCVLCCVAFHVSHQAVGQESPISALALFNQSGWSRQAAMRTTSQDVMWIRIPPPPRTLLCLYFSTNLCPFCVLLQADFWRCGQVFLH